jgi:endonuclease YncB( thermonuclease family)
MKTKTPSFSAPAAGALALVLSVFMAASDAGAAQPWTIEGKVVYVDDGDTLILLQADKSKASIRLSDIDAPEVSHGQGRPGQPFSDQSRKSLTDMARGAQASATCYERDRYERLVCTVFVNGQDLNAEQVRRGMAWANHANARYVRNPQTYVYEKQAKSQAVGLWAGLGQGQAPIPPWEWRQQCWKSKACDGAQAQ